MTIFDFSVKDKNGNEKSLQEYKGKAVLIVNTASKCGFTNQYEGLQELYLKYNNKGLEILAFPCNQFLRQEQGSNDEIQQFCKLNYRVTFPVFSKIKVNGKNADPLYNYLKDEKSSRLGKKIKWNFTKFLINKDGIPVKRYESAAKPEEIEPDINELLK